MTIQTLLVPTSFERYPAKEIGPGVYAIELSPAEAGVYYVTVASAAIGLTHDNPNVLILRVLPARRIDGGRDECTCVRSQMKIPLSQQSDRS